MPTRLKEALDNLQVAVELMAQSIATTRLQMAAGEATPNGTGRRRPHTAATRAKIAAARVGQDGGRLRGAGATAKFRRVMKAIIAYRKVNDLTQKDMEAAIFTDGSGVGGYGHWERKAVTGRAGTYPTAGHMKTLAEFAAKNCATA